MTFSRLLSVVHPLTLHPKHPEITEQSGRRQGRKRLVGTGITSCL